MVSVWFIIIITTTTHSHLPVQLKPVELDRRVVSKRDHDLWNYAVVVTPC